MCNIHQRILIGRSCSAAYWLTQFDTTCPSRPPHRLAYLWGYCNIQAWAGRDLVLIDPKHTSQTCSVCEVLDPASRNGKNFRCRGCGVELDADLNASVNILKRAMAGGNLPAAALDAA